MAVAGSAAPTARRRRPSHDSEPPPCCGEPRRGDADPQAVGAEGRGEDEQHAAGDDGFGAAVGAEGERIAEHRDESEAERRGEQERPFARHRRDGGGELAPHEAQIDTHELERLARREQRGERVAVEEE
jgi:hypothetical protein